MTAGSPLPRSPVAASRPRRLLVDALRLNAWFSVTTGAVALLGAVALDRTLGAPAPVLTLLGVGLVGYADLLRRAAAGSLDTTRIGRLAVAADLLWVVAAGAMLLVAPEVLTTAGRWTLAAVTLVVLDLAVVQAVGLRRMARSPR